MTVLPTSKPGLFYLCLTVFASAGLFVVQTPAYGQTLKEMRQPALQAPASEEEILQETVENAGASQNDFSKLESIGLYQKSGDGSLGRDLWKGSQRSDVVSLLRNMPASSTVPVMQKLIYGVLLSAVDAGQLQNDVPPEAGADLLTLRMEKLLEAGAYDRAYEMYSLLDEEPYDASLARTGILSMLYSGEKSVACLEANAFEGQPDKENFWDKLAAYCDVTLSDQPDAASAALLQRPDSGVLGVLATQKDYRFSYSPETFSALSPLERALVTAEKKIGTKAFSAETVAAVPPAQILPLLLQPDLNEESRLLLTLRAARWGLRKAAGVKELYMQMAAPAAGADVSKLAPPEKEWEKLPYFYIVISNAESDKEKWLLLTQAHSLVKEYGAAAFSPLAAMIRDMRPETTTPQDIAMVLNVLNTAGLDIPAFWREKAAQIPDSSEGFNPLPAWGTAYVLTPKSTEKTELSEKISKKIESADNHTQQLYNIIIENLDNTSQDRDNADTAYEKEYGLTFAKDYVMPSSDVWDRIIKSGHAGSAGETILLGTILFRDQALRDVYPKLLEDVMQSFENVGLTHISKDIAVTASLNGIE
jgi:hypothetical protein